MTKFLEYITEYQEREKYEGSRVKEITPKAALHIIKTRASKALAEYKKGKHISRYTITARDIFFGFLDASKLPSRMSRNTLNYYTHIINDDSDWAKFPRRQVIATYKDKRPFHDSGEFTIFPFDNTNIGVAEQDDLWNSFPVLRKHRHAGAQDFNQFIEKLLQKNGVAEGADDSLASFKKATKKFDEWYKKKKIALESDGEDIGEYMELISYNMGRVGTQEWFFTEDYYTGNLYEDIKKVFSTKNFKTMKPGQYSKAKQDNEVWFEGPAVYVNSNFVVSLLEGA